MRKINALLLTLFFGLSFGTNAAVAEVWSLNGLDLVITDKEVIIGGKPKKIRNLSKKDVCIYGNNSFPAVKEAWGYARDRFRSDSAWIMAADKHNLIQDWMTCLSYRRNFLKNNEITLKEVVALKSKNSRFPYLDDSDVCALAVTRTSSGLSWSLNASEMVEEAKNRGLACNIVEDKNTTSQILSKASGKRAWLGIFIKEISPDIVELLKLQSSAGALLHSMEENSPAQVAGLEPDDVIVSFNGRMINKMRDLPRIVAETGVVGSTVPIEVIRKGQRVEFQITIGNLDTAKNVGPRSSQIEETPPSTANADIEKMTKPPSTPVEDGNPPTISIASNTVKGPQAKIEGRVFDEAGIAEVIIDGSAVSLGGDGSFTASFYIPRSGKTVEIVAFDTKGNKATKSLVLERGQMRKATGPSFASLNPSGKRVKPNQNALALIIGVADYERTPARAAYADKDAQTFYDYAMLKLGIPASNIKELVNADANEAEVRLAVKDWIARSTRQGQSDVYVFFAGHGLANQSGDDMYLLPVDGEPRLLSDTAIARERLFADIAAANPRSVTVFLDTCYSGTTRGTDMLIASRPIAIRAKDQAIPEGFTVMTAAAGDQTAKPLEEAKHGMFSYFLMKGMEGDADANSDNQITAGELHAYVQQNVMQQSSGSQTPELQGDADRVLIRFQ